MPNNKWIVTKPVSDIVRCTSGHEYNQMSIITCMHMSGSVYNVNVRIWFFIINYVSKHQLQHVIDASHITPTTRANQDPKLLKLIGWRHCLCFWWACAYLGPRPRLLTLNDDLPQGNQVTCITCITWTRTELGYQSPHGNPTMKPSFGCAT